MGGPPQGEQTRLPTIAAAHHNAPSPHTTPGEGPKGGSTHCPNIWTSLRAKIYHADVSKARCWVSAESRHLDAGVVLVLEGEGWISVRDLE